jgi:hypothetical protein
MSWVLPFVAGAARAGWLFAWCVCCALLATPAAAVLGERESSIDADQARLAGVRRVAALAQHPVQVHSVLRADGSAVHQYVGADGIVFAIAWNTRVKPDLQTLLGSQAGLYDEAARRAMARPGIRHHALLEQGDLVVESSAHLNAFVGRAYLKSRLPGGMTPDAIR